MKNKAGENKPRRRGVAGIKIENNHIIHRFYSLTNSQIFIIALSSLRRRASAVQSIP
jgi:hypothetical protein